MDVRETDNPHVILVDGNIFVNMRAYIDGAASGALLARLHAEASGNPASIMIARGMGDMVLAMDDAYAMYQVRYTVNDLSSLDTDLSG